MPTAHHKIVGKVRFAALSGGRIQLLDGFQNRNIVTVHIPELKGVPTYGGRFSGNVRWYKGAVNQLKAAFAEIGARGFAKDIIFWDGSFVPRMKRNSRTSPSEHTFGCALDINARWNGMGVTPAAPGTKGSVWRLVPIFEKHGFNCGARWGSPDAMHFQIKRVMNAAPVVQSPVAPVVPPSVIIVDVTGKVTRLRSDKRDGANWAPIRAAYDAAGVEIGNEGRWKDGTPVLYLK